MNKKKIIIALVIVAVLLGCYFLINNYNNKENEQNKTSDVFENITIFKTEAENIVSIKIETTKDLSGTYKLVKNDDKWLVEGFEEIKLDKSKVEQLVYDCAYLNADKVISENSDGADYGLNNPIGRVTVTMSDGKSVIFMIGSKVPTGLGYYFKLDGENKVYSIYSTKGDLFMSKLDDLRDKNLLDVDKEKITLLEINNKNTTISIRPKDYNEENEEFSLASWEMTSPYEKDVNEEVLNKEILDKIQDLDISEFVEDNPTDYSKYGLDNSLTSLLVECDGKTTVLHFGNEEEGYVYVKVDGEKPVYKISNESTGFRYLNPLLLVDSLVYLRNIDTVNNILIEGNGAKYNLAISRNGDTATYKINDKDIEESKFKKLFQSIIGLTIKGAVEEDFEKKSEILVTVAFNNGKESEVVAFMPYKDRYYAVSINGKMEYYILKQDVEEVFNNINELLK